jgi:hypothetical protein
MQHLFNETKTMWDSGDAWIPHGGLLIGGIFNEFPIWKILLWGRFVCRMFCGQDVPLWKDHRILMSGTLAETERDAVECGVVRHGRRNFNGTNP